MKSHIHGMTLAIWILFRLVFTFEEHSGYDFPCHLNKVLPFTVSSDHHNYHHEKNIGNYSEFTGFWDKVFGTEEAYVEYRKTNPIKSTLEKSKKNV
jgi:sterol desaturase/sphingolipid hydroxylase (fatty acid hydroxylase superfamily)